MQSRYKILYFRRKKLHYHSFVSLLFQDRATKKKKKEKPNNTKQKREKNGFTIMILNCIIMSSVRDTCQLWSTSMKWIYKR